MSLPPIASWEYDYQPEPGSREAETISFLKKDIDWLK
jgi:coproporphyrinogen III oxidase